MLVSVGNTDGLHKACSTQNAQRSPGDTADARARKGICKANLQHLGVSESKERFNKAHGDGRMPKGS